MCCTDEQKAKYNPAMLEILPSHISPSYAFNNKTKDNYAAFNKPGYEEFTHLWQPTSSQPMHGCFFEPLCLLPYAI